MPGLTRAQGVMEVPNVQGFDDDVSFFAFCRAGSLRKALLIMPQAIEKMLGAEPMARGGKPVEVANLAVFLASEGASFINGADYLRECDPAAVCHRSDVLHQWTVAALRSLTHEHLATVSTVTIVAIVVSRRTALRQRESR
jgi:NAD(P)-dependent dehydrogenase (short-subunit alcohol dehydrogenase family)